MMDTSPTLTRTGRPDAGFTLLELMVTLSIGSVLLAVGVPSMTDMIRGARLASQTDLLVSTLNLARMEAIKQRTRFKVCPAATPLSAVGCSAAPADWSKGWIVITVPAPPPAPVIAAVIGQRIETKSGLTVSTSATGVEFDGTLGSAVAVGSFTLCAPGRNEQLIDVSLSGHIGKRIGSSVCL